MDQLQGKGGFSLVELMISVIIISIGMIGFATAVGLMATELWFGRRDTEISLLIADKIEELKSQGGANISDGSLSQGTYTLDWTIVSTAPTRVRMVASYPGNDGATRADTLITYIRN